MILGWQDVEDKVDQRTVQEFQLFYTPENQDPRVDIIRDRINLPTKLDFLKTMGRISANDLSVIKEFQTERNKLFHGDLYSSRHPVIIAATEKTRLMELANTASKIVTNRAFGVWFEEGTVDVGNKNVSKLERPKGSTLADERLKRIILEWNRDEPIS